jgi:hypothetical protein
MYPFLYYVPGVLAKDSKWIVIIASAYTWRPYDAKWMNDTAMSGKSVYVPDVDLEESNHSFDNENDALAFIRDWWKGRVIYE